MTSRAIKRVAGLGLLIIMAGASVAVAQHSGSTTHAEVPSHSHKAHHGGQVKVAGDYHIELVTEANKYIVYLLDVRERTIDLNGVSGLAIFRDGVQTTGSHRLSAGSNGYFEVPLKGQAHTAVIITFKVDGKSIIAKFDKDARYSFNFFCPQKCTGSDSNLGGNCPTCGTALADRRLVAKD